MTCDVNPKSCPWCGDDAYTCLSGSYCAGWTCFIGCSNEDCGSRGPTYRSGFRSNGEEKTERLSVKAWNKVSIKE